MAKSTVTLFVLMFAFSQGCRRQTLIQQAETPSGNPSVEIKIESAQTVFKASQDVTIMITIKNVTSKELDAPETYWSACVVLDGKEYKRLPESIGPWNGPGVILPNGGLFRTGLALSEYGIGPNVLTPGKHEIAVRIKDDISNRLTIEIE